MPSIADWSFAGSSHQLSTCREWKCWPLYFSARSSTRSRSILDSIISGLFTCPCFHTSSIFSCRPMIFTGLWNFHEVSLGTTYGAPCTYWREWWSFAGRRGAWPGSQSSAASSWEICSVQCTLFLPRGIDPISWTYRQFATGSLCLSFLTNSWSFYGFPSWASKRRWSGCSAWSHWACRCCRLSSCFALCGPPCARRCPASAPVPRDWGWIP